GATITPPDGPPPEANAARDALGLAADDFVVGHFGFVNHSKGVDTLLEAVARLCGAGISARLVMIGERVGASDPSNAAYGAEIDAHAARLGITPIWTGFAAEADLPRYFAALDALAVPFRDGAAAQRTSLQAGLAYGCAIVTTAPTHPDDLPEIIPNEHLLTVPPEDPAALAEALHSLYADPAARARLRTGAQIAAQRFAWPGIAARILDVYRTVIQEQ
ncbi:MAG: glycosyltransferase family 4 protein, partial [Anaerolineales bacterium]